MSTTIVHYLPEDELIQQAIAALMAALGPVEAMRFLSITKESRVESVIRHREWQASLNQKDFYDQVFGAMGTKD